MSVFLNGWEVGFLEGMSIWEVLDHLKGTKVPWLCPF